MADILNTHIQNIKKRERREYENTVEYAKIFHKKDSTYCTELLRCHPDPADNEIGVLGTVKAYLMAVETQGRGPLHGHAVVMLHGCTSPALLHKKIAESVADPAQTFNKGFLAYLDSIMSQEFPQLSIKHI